MGVAIDHRLEPGGRRVQVEVVQDVDEIDLYALSDADRFSLMQLQPQLAVIGVAADRRTGAIRSRAVRMAGSPTSPA